MHILIASLQRGTNKPGGKKTHIYLQADGCSSQVYTHRTMGGCRGRAASLLWVLPPLPEPEQELGKRSRQESSRAKASVPQGTESPRQGGEGAGGRK